MNPKKLLALAVPLLLAPTVLMGANVAEVLRKAEAADKHVSYRGTKTATVCFDGRSATATLKVIHLKPDKTRTQYFAPTALAGIIVIQDGIDFWKYSPREHAWEPIRQPCPQQGGICHQAALENFDLKLIGDDRVAGRPTYVLYAVPRHRGESAHRLWVDRDCFLIIATQVEASNGAVVSSSRYDHVEINPPDISPSLFKVSGKVSAPSCGAGSARFVVVKPSYLPSGYRLVGRSCLTINGASSSHLQFTNGANTISLFQRREQKDAPPAKVASKVTNVLTWARSGMRFTLMGDVPRTELQKIADSVR